MAESNPGIDHHYRAGIIVAALAVGLGTVLLTVVSPVTAAVAVTAPGFVTVNDGSALAAGLARMITAALPLTGGPR